MSTLEHGSHPWHRLVHRLGKISPHRQVQLLCVISVVTVAVMVMAVLGSLDPPLRSLQISDDGLVPAIGRLDAARQNYDSAGGALQGTVSADPSVRAAGLTELTSLNSAGLSAWRAYRRVAAHLPGERAMQRRFEVDRAAALAAGLRLFGDTTPSAEALAEVTRLGDALQLDLNRLKKLYETTVHQSISTADQQVEATERKVMIVSGAALVVLLIAFGIAARSARAREERLDTLDRAMHADAERNELEARLQRSLEMAHTEAAAYALAGRALSITATGMPAELLVADSSRAHFRQAATTDEHGGPGCQVMLPTDCPAATWGQTQIWNSSTALDACPYLRDRPGGDCSAVCVPVSIGGNTVGVVHATNPDTQPPDDPTVERIELIARKVGERIGMLRAFSRSETQARTDPLTGLLNRRSLEAQVRDLSREGGSYVVAYGDLDFFKQLNDVHGHDAGDKALRLFARVLSDSVRPNDLVGRYGGEEFVVVLPNCALPDAFTVIDRIRERLAGTLQGGTVPPFTASFGLAGSQPGFTFSETLEIADAALLDAKAKGRDRVIIGGTGVTDLATSVTGAILPELTV